MFQLEAFERGREKKQKSTRTSMKSYEIVCKRSNNEQHITSEPPKAVELSNERMLDWLLQLLLLAMTTMWPAIKQTAILTITVYTDRFLGEHSARLGPVCCCICCRNWSPKSRSFATDTKKALELIRVFLQIIVLCHIDFGRIGGGTNGCQRQWYYRRIDCNSCR